MEQRTCGAHIKDLWVVRGCRFHDERGLFEEVYSERDSPGDIRVDKLRQISISISKRDVLRGLHTSPYSKLVNIVHGAVYDVVVDFREGSPTFGKWVANILSAESKLVSEFDELVFSYQTALLDFNSIHIPAGCGHGYLALEETTMVYVQQGCFDPSLERDVSPFDPSLDIYWPRPLVETNYIMSSKDSTAPGFIARYPHLSQALPTGRNLVLGISGQVGRALVEELGCSNCFGTFSHNEVTDAVQLCFNSIVVNPTIMSRLLTSTKPAVVYICAAKTWVDGCETHVDEAKIVNRDAPVLITKMAKSFGAKVVFFSTDYVFDGCAGPYDEGAKTSPINVYGRSKLDAEESVMKEDATALVIRTTVVYGPEELGKNFVYQLASKLRTGESFACLDDQYSTPTYSRDLAKMVTRLVTRKCSGVYHCAGQEVMTRYQFATRVVRMLGFDESLLEKVSTEHLESRALQAGKRVAKRGLHLGLRVGKTVTELDDFKPLSVEESVRDWLAHPAGKSLLG